MPHPWCKPCPWENASNAIHFSVEIAHSRDCKEKHAKLCASLITFYPICMDVRTDAMKPNQPYPCTIGSFQSAIDNAIYTLWPSFVPPSHEFLWIMSVHSSQLPYRQHSLQPHSEGEYLQPLYAHGMLMWTKDCGHPEESTMVSKQMLNNIHLLPFFLTLKKMQTQHWLHQSITHLPACFKKHALSIGTTHWCTNVPKNANRMACLKNAMLSTTFFAFKENSRAVHIQIQKYNFLFNPSELSKKHAHKWPIPDADHLHEKMLQTQTTA